MLLTSCAGGVPASAPVVSGTPAPTSSSAPTPPTTTPPASVSPTPTPPPVLPTSGTGPYGYVMAGPTCPVERPGHPCPPRPVSETVDARTGVGTTVASTRSDAHGRFALDLSPGVYTLVVLTPTGWPRCPAVSVTVRSATPVRADISCDTGLR
ncbi:MAG TPA: hypothetical protein VHO26_03870 [Propionibacteriaceae bacterium]|nr:hypothetical protein [Propionibacteriaceae bacterium]